MEAQFNSSLVVFAEKVLQMQQAKRNYFKVYKSGLQNEKQKALSELKQIENEVDTLIYGVLHKPEERRAVAHY